MEVVEIRVTESVLEANFGSEAQIEYIDHAVRIDVHTSRDALVSNADDMAGSAAWNALEGERAKWSRCCRSAPMNCLPGCCNRTWT